MQSIGIHTFKQFYFITMRLVELELYIMFLLNFSNVLWATIYFNTRRQVIQASIAWSWYNTRLYNQHTLVVGYEKKRKK